MKKSQVDLMDDQGKVKKDIVVGSAAQDQEEAKSSQKKGKQAEEEGYQVMGIEEEGSALVNGVFSQSRQG